jgi:tetratricopeptide (TPR) repeat protein
MITPRKLVVGLLASLGVLLYGIFLSNPLVFDDIYFFLTGHPEKHFAEGLQFHPRAWVYFSHAMTFVYLGPEIFWQRLGNLVAHVSTGLALYVLIRRLLLDLDRNQARHSRIEWVAFLAALLFLLHPVAVYATGYLIQRTILMATLFSLLTWLAFWLGLRGSRRWLWASVLFYFLAVFSKEHAVMAPAVCAGLWILHRRSLPDVPVRVVETSAVLLIQAGIALLVTYLAVGGAHEILAPEMMRDMAERGFEVPEGLAYPLSVLTQAGLFFKYLGLWAFPNVTAMAVDMREPFVLSATLPRWLILGAFCLYPLIAAGLLWRGRTLGLAGFALLTPWLLFATELVSVRLQEIFVLYRSYLWAPALFILLALGLARLSTRMAVGVGMVIAVFLFALSFDRLTSFSHPFLLWDEAARVAEKNAGKPGVAGMARIYHNRGLALYREGMVDLAIRSYDQALAEKPDYSYVYNDRGAARLDLKNYVGALGDFDTAIRLKPDYLRPYAGRAMALKGLGRTNEAEAAFARACALGWQSACSGTAGVSK